MKFERRIATTEFAAIIIIELFVLPLIFSKVADLDIDWDINLIMSELVLVIPALFLLAIWYFVDMYKGETSAEYESISISERLMFKPVRLRTVLWTVLFYILINPLSVLCNMISMQFTGNEMLQSADKMIDMSFPAAFFLIVIYGPVCEEFVFRGLIYGGYRRYCKPLPAIVMSGLMFGLMHLNFNQFCYAFVYGIALALLVEASGSIFMSILFHMMINGSSTVYLFLLNKFDSELLGSIIESGSDTTSFGVEVFAVYVVVSIICTALAGLVLKRIARLEDREDPILLITHSREYKGKPVLSVLLLLSIAAYVFVIVMDFIS